MMRIARTALIGAVLAAGAYAAWHFTRPAPHAAAEPPSVPVSVASAKQGELPVYMHTIGAVRALNSVEIRPQVGGVLVDVAVKEGDRVKKDQVLAVIDPRPYKAALDKAQAQLKQDQAQLENAMRDQQRYAALAQRDFASRQQLDTQVATVNRLQGVVAADQAAIDEANINLGFTLLRAPLDGKIGLRRVDAGNLIQANSTGPGIFLVVQEQPMSVIFSMPETDLPTIKDAMAKGTLTTLADTPDGGRVLAKGVLQTTDNAVDSNSGTIQMRANFDNADGALTPGQYVDVRLQVGTATGVTVPHGAVMHGQQGLFVFAVDPDNTVQRHDVKVAYDDATTAILLDGPVKAGAKVVTAGQSRIGQGIKVAYKGEDDGSGGASKIQQSANQ